MPSWFRRLRRLRLRSDDREQFTATQGSEELATSMLEAARKKAAGLTVGSEVQVEVPRGHGGVHNMELGLSLVTRAAEYGLEFALQHDNTVTFRKT